MRTKVLNNRLWTAILVALLWPLFVDALDRIFQGSWRYDFFVNELSGFTLAWVVWIALGQYQKRQEALEERYQVMRTLAHHISNPVQILLGRDHLPADKKEMAIDKAVKELVKACLEIIPNLMSQNNERE